MFVPFKRLALGLLLIAGTSALLLFSDLRSRIKPEADSAPVSNRQVRVALLQHATQNILDDGRHGVLAGLAERGWIVGENLQLKYYNSEGDIAVAQTIAKEMTSGDYDLLLTITTPSLQAVANANKNTRRPHVFALVADPKVTGTGISTEKPLEHPTYMAGYGTLQPVSLAFKLAREMNPSLASVGVVYNPAEANSVAQISLARNVCAELGITLVELNVDNSSGVAEASGALIARGVEAIFALGDVSVITAIDTITANARKAGIPVFSVLPPLTKHGALFDLGADYFEVGRHTGVLAGDILNGRDPATVAIENYMPELLLLNLQTLAGLKGKWTIPAALRERASVIIDENGVEHAKPKAKPATQSATAAPRAKPGRNYKLAFAAYAPDPSMDNCQQGVLDGLKEFGFIEGQNLTVSRTHAQGEMVNVPPMLQSLDATDADAVVTFTTPVLQSALGTIKRKPVVFTYVTDPLIAGAGKTYEDHVAHVTGIGSLPPIAETIAMMRRVLPHVKTLGVIYNNSEANSIKIIGLLREATKEAGINLIELTAANANEVLQATQAIVSRGIDAFYVPGDNTAYLGFEAIRKTTQDAKIPLIVDDAEYIDRGAIFACGPGFYHSGKAAAPALARVLLGESPAGIPMGNVSVNTIKFNREAIARHGLQIDEALIRELEASSTTPTTAIAPANPNPTGKKWKIAYLLYSETPPAEETLEGMKAAWARSPLVAGRDYEITIRNAQADIAALSGIIDAALTEGADIIVPISTPSLQMAVQKVKRVPIVFSMVANPMAAGAGKSYTDHLPNVTGVTVISPYAEALDLLQKHYPNYKRFGTIFCPAEANSVDLKEALEAECARRGIKLESVAANTATDLPEAALSLMSKPIDAVLQISDNLSSGGFTAIARAARQSRKPLFSLNSTTVPLGAPLAFGRDYHNTGETTVEVIERVIRGEKPADIPFTLPPKVIKVADLANAAAVSMTLPPALLQEIGHGDNSTATVAPNPAGKKWRIACVYYNETAAVEQTLAGMTAAWQRSTLASGRDYELSFHSAQGDMAVLGTIIDSIQTSGADLIVPITTPALQTAVQRVRRTPMVFALVSDPMIAGAGKSYTDHLPNLTGAPVPAGCADAVALIRKHFPSFTRLGSVYCPAESNSVAVKDELEAACREHGITLELVAANSPAELPDAALALVTRPIDAVLQISDNLSNAGFTAITRAARQARKPLFSLTDVAIPYGSAVAIGRDYHSCGEVAVSLIERVIRGENPAQIPFTVPNVSTTVSPTNAAALGMTLPPSLLAEPGVIVK